MAEARSITCDEVAALVRRLQIEKADDAFIARATELNTILMQQLAGLPTDFGKDVEAAHVFTLPLR